MHTTMASKILINRTLISGLPKMACMTSRAPMSTSTPAKKPTINVEPIKGGEKKDESWRSFFAPFLGGAKDPADPNDPPIPANKVLLPDITEHATGEAKLFLLAFENGILDPYCNLPVERKEGEGTKDNPIKVQCFPDSCIVGCVCEPTMTHTKYMNLYKNEPTRCKCGYWLELVDAPKFWMKIPKEDLLTIPYFQELEAEGLLDKLLAGEEVEGFIEKH